MRWNIYYGDREFAKDRGDPCLGVVEAETKEEAEKKAGLGGFLQLYLPTTVWGAGFWAVKESEDGN